MDTYSNIYLSNLGMVYANAITLYLCNFENIVWLQHVWYICIQTWAILHNWPKLLTASAL